jgi:hypothetical protein
MTSDHGCPISTVGRNVVVPFVFSVSIVHICILTMYFHFLKCYIVDDIWLRLNIYIRGPYSHDIFVDCHCLNIHVSIDFLKYYMFNVCVCMCVCV